MAVAVAAAAWTRVAGRIYIDLQTVRGSSLVRSLRPLQRCSLQGFRAMSSLFVSPPKGFGFHLFGRKEGFKVKGRLVWVERVGRIESGREAEVRNHPFLKGAYVLNAVQLSHGQARSRFASFQNVLHRFRVRTKHRYIYTNTKIVRI